MMIAMVFVSGNSRRMFSTSSDLIVPHPSHGVLLGQHGWFNPAHFDCREQHRRCRIQVCPVLLDEASRGRTKSDDQIGRSLSVERPEIFNKFGLSSVVAIPSRDEGLFLNVQRPRRLSVQFIAGFPCSMRPPARNSGQTNEGTGFFSAERQSRQTWAERQSRQLRPKERRRRRSTY